MMMTVETKQRSGQNRVSNYQRMLIRAVLEHGSRKNAATALDINIKTFEDNLYRAFRALNVNNISDANYLINQGVFSRKEMQSTE
jgi:hypothetical protein